MRTFLCEIDHTGLRRLSREDLIPADELRRLDRGSARCPAFLFWSLLADDVAEDLRADIDTGRHAQAYAMLMNRAVEITSLGAASAIARGGS